MTAEKTEEKDWREEVLADTHEFVGTVDSKFKECARRSFERAPLVESHADVFKGYSGALVDTFFHLFSHFVGDELDMEENLVADLKERFAVVRQQKLAAQTKQGVMQ